MTLSDPQQLLILKALENQPSFTQRELSNKADLSLGRTNYVVKVLVEKGRMKLENFTRSGNELGYFHLGTPMGLEKKVSLTRSFLARKHAEFDTLQAEIKALEAELEGKGREGKG